MEREPDPSRRRRRAVISNLVLLASGVLGALAYPKTGWALLAWIWLVPAFASGATRAPRSALADGWLAGTVFHVVLLRWLGYTFCGLYLGLVTGATAWLRRGLGTGPALALTPALWVASEWLRGHLMGGFPWGLLGYSQATQLPVIQIAELGGVYAVSLLVAAVNAALAALLALGVRRAWRGLATATALLTAALGFGFHAISTEAISRAGSVEVAVIQPSIEQTIKWDPTRHAQIMDIYEGLTRQAARAHPVAVLWPETATTIFLRGDPALLGRLTLLSADLGIPILVGAIDRREGSS
jgi:apolipoprotein N-acyltransferase